MKKYLKIKVNEVWDKKWIDLDFNKFQKECFINDNWTILHKPIIDKYLRQLPDQGLFLEAGCGMGHWCFYSAEKYKIKSVGVDIAENTISKLNEYSKGNDRVDFVVDDLNNSKLNENFCDLFISLGVIEHFKNHQLMMSNLYKILKHRGIGIITTPNIYSMHTFTRPILQFIGKWDIGYEKSFSPNKLKKEAKQAGFKVVDSGVLCSGELFGCFLNSLPIIGKIFRKLSLLIEKNQKTFGFVSYVVIQKL
jgi:SAM-dependent methyltransferase